MKKTAFVYPDNLLFHSRVLAAVFISIFIFCLNNLIFSLVLQRPDSLADRVTALVVEGGGLKGTIHSTVNLVPYL